MNTGRDAPRHTDDRPPRYAQRSRVARPIKPFTELLSPLFNIPSFKPSSGTIEADKDGGDSNPVLGRPPAETPRRFFNP